MTNQDDVVRSALTEVTTGDQAKVQRRSSIRKVSKVFAVGRSVCGSNLMVEFVYRIEIARALLGAKENSLF